MNTCKRNTIELLEPRIAPAAVVTFTDVDGDAVTIKVSKGSQEQVENALHFTPMGAGSRLDLIDFAPNPIVFKGASVTITAEVAGGGDGFVQVGRINAAKDGNPWIGLGKVIVDGDLGEIDAQAYVRSGMSLVSLTARSLGGSGFNLPASGGDGNSGLGNVGSIILSEDLGGSLNVFNVKQLTIKGMLDTTLGGSAGRIGAEGIGKLLVNNVAAGSVFCSGRIGTATLGDLTGGTGDFSGYVQAVGGFNSVLVNGSITGGSGRQSGQIAAGNLLAYVDGTDTSPSYGAVGKVVVTGSIIGGAGLASGRLDLLGKTGTVSIAGTLQGGSADLAGGISLGGPPSGSKPFSIGSLAIGSVIGGTGDFTAVFPDGFVEYSQVYVEGNLKSLRVTDSITLGMGIASGRVFVSGALGAATVKNFSGGSLIAGTIGKMHVSGDVAGTADDPALIAAQTQIKAIQIDGNLTFGNVFVGAMEFTFGFASQANDLTNQTFSKQADCSLGTLLVKGNWQGSNVSVGVDDVDGDGFGNSDDAIVTDGVIDNPFIVAAIKSIVIVGDVQETATVGDRFGIVAQQIGSIRVGTTVVALKRGPANDAIPIDADLSLREVAF
jgi:hypothetical protein